jgi:uncharacterized metal-binding protein
MSENQKHWQEGMKTHENIIFACFGCLSNTGITAKLASLEAVKELGLEKAAVGCLASLPLGIAPVVGKTKAAKKIITFDIGNARYSSGSSCSRPTIFPDSFRGDTSLLQ